MKCVRKTAGYTWTDHTTNSRIHLDRSYNKQQDTLGQIIQQTAAYIWTDHTTNSRMHLDRSYNKQQDTLGQIIEQTHRFQKK